MGKISLVAGKRVLDMQGGGSVPDLSSLPSWARSGLMQWFRGQDFSGGPGMVMGGGPGGTGEFHGIPSPRLPSFGGPFSPPTGMVPAGGMPQIKQPLSTGAYNAIGGGGTGMPQIRTPLSTGAYNAPPPPGTAPLGQMWNGKAYVPIPGGPITPMRPIVGVASPQLPLVKAQQPLTAIPGASVPKFQRGTSDVEEERGPEWKGSATGLPPGLQRLYEAKQGPYKEGGPGTAIDWRQKPGSTDSVPAMLTPGEAVLNRGAAALAGKPAIDALNREGMPAAVGGMPGTPPPFDYGALNSQVSGIPGAGTPPAPVSALPATPVPLVSGPQIVGGPTYPAPNKFPSLLQRGTSEVDRPSVERGAGDSNSSWREPDILEGNIPRATGPRNFWLDELPPWLQEYLARRAEAEASGERGSPYRTEAEMLGEPQRLQYGGNVEGIGEIPPEQEGLKWQPYSFSNSQVRDIARKAEQSGIDPSAIAKLVALIGGSGISGAGGAGGYGSGPIGSYLGGGGYAPLSDPGSFGAVGYAQGGFVEPQELQYGGISNRLRDARDFYRGTLGQTNTGSFSAPFWQARFSRAGSGLGRPSFQPGGGYLSGAGMGTPGMGGSLGPTTGFNWRPWLMDRHQRGAARGLAAGGLVEPRHLQIGDSNLDPQLPPGAQDNRANDPGQWFGSGLGGGGFGGGPIGAWLNRNEGGGAATGGNTGVFGGGPLTGLMRYARFIPQVAAARGLWNLGGLARQFFSGFGKNPPTGTAAPPPPGGTAAPPAGGSNWLQNLLNSMNQGGYGLRSGRVSGPYAGLGWRPGVSRTFGPSGANLGSLGMGGSLGPATGYQPGMGDLTYNTQQGFYYRPWTDPRAGPPARAGQGQ